MIKVTPEEGYEKLSRNLKNAQTDMQRGVERVTESPTKKAARNLEKARRNYNAAIDSGKTERGLLRVELPEWQSKMINVGIPRVAAGIDAAKDKTIDFNRQFYPHLEAGQKKLESMPNMDLEQNIQRMVAMTRHNANFKRK